MSSPLITVKAYAPIDTTAARAMTKNKIKRLLVLEADGSVAQAYDIFDRHCQEDGQNTDRRLQSLRLAQGNSNSGQ